MLKIIEKFESIINVAMLALVLLLATIDLGWIIVKDIMTPPVLLLTAGYYTSSNWPHEKQAELIRHLLQTDQRG